MSQAEEINADMLAFWNGKGGHIWVARQAHTDTTLQAVSDALIAHAAPRAGERVLDVGCGCGASTLDFARAVGPTGFVTALDISGPMLDEARLRAAAGGVTNVHWQQADAATMALEPYDLLTSNFGLMFFGDQVAAFRNMRRAARPGARMVFVCWRSLEENPWIEVPMRAAALHLPPRPKAEPNSPGMFAFADPAYVSEVLTAAGWSAPRMEKFDCTLDIAAGLGLDEAVAQSTQIGAVNSWLRDKPPEVVAAAMISIREAFSPFVDESAVRLPAATWIVSSAPGN
jgi:SAM-dependent methyltransferase